MYENRAASANLSWTGVMQSFTEEHRLKTRRVDSPEACRPSPCNALLGAVQAQIVIADGTDSVSVGELEAAREQLRALGAEGDLEKLIGFLRWQALRFSLPLQRIAAREQAGPVPVTAAHAIEAVKVLLEVVGTGQSIATADARVHPPSV